MQPMAAAGIGDLIVVLQIDDEAVLGNAEGGLAAAAAGPAVLLALDPVAGVGDEEVADRAAALAVEVDRFTPIGLVALALELWREGADVIAIGAEMVVDDVEDDAETEGVCAIDEGAHVVGRAVEAGRG